MKLTTFIKDRILAVAALLAISFSGITFSACTTNDSPIPRKVTFTREALLDKIKGGWAAQTIGVTYGGPTEFEYRSAMIPDSVNIPWGEPDYVANYMKRVPSLYDDIYMDLTFVEVFDRLGIDAPVDSLAMAFATARYPLWHANQAARYNILRGIMPPASGHWLNNPHADDIDYQIEADYAGLMSPGMPNAASEISDRVGHIMNYGDGWYGGVYVGAMYSLAFISENIEFIVTEALKVIPAESKFHKMMSDIISYWRENPNDWKYAWQRCHEEWEPYDVGCSEGALDPLNIDASINSAFIVIGLLYGNGDFGRTIDIATRCGQDSDCNPASAVGILGTAIGYNRIPAFWLDPLKKAEDLKFAYTSSSLNDTYAMSMRHALKVIEREGGKIDGDQITIKCQQPKPVALEQSFPNLKPKHRMQLGQQLSAEPYTFECECDAMVINGSVKCADKEYVAKVEITVDGATEIAEMPALYRLRRLDIYWNFELRPGRHDVSVRWLNPVEGATIAMPDVVLYEKVE